MRKQLIKKFQNSGQFWNNTANMANQISGQANMNFSQSVPKFDPKTGFKTLSTVNDPLALPKMDTSLMGPKTGLAADTLSSGKAVSPVTPKNTSGFGSFIKGNIGTIGQGADMLSSLIPEQTNSNLTKGLNKGFDMAADTISKIPGGEILGGAMKLNAAFGKGLSAMTGGATTIKDPSNVSDSVLSSSFFATNIGLLNAVTGKKVAGNSKALASMASSSSYGDSGSLGATKIGGITNTFSKWFGKKDLAKERKANVLKINTENMKKADVLQTNKQQLAARNQAARNREITTENQLAGGQDYSVLAAKKGATLQDIRNYIKVRNIKKEVVQNPNLDDNLEKSEIQKFQNGGSLIPSGALHKNKHNLESVNSDLDGEITKKGIPVISYAEEGDILEYENDGKTPKLLAEGGEVIQHAEIEKDEVILNLSLTKKLVELMKKDTPEAMIEAGKILARELMENTTDNTGLIEKTIGNED